MELERKDKVDRAFSIHELAERGMSKEILRLVERQLETDIEEKVAVYSNTSINN